MFFILIIILVTMLSISVPVITELTYLMKMLSLYASAYVYECINTCLWCSGRALGWGTECYRSGFKSRQGPMHRRLPIATLGIFPKTNTNTKIQNIQARRIVCIVFGVTIYNCSLYNHHNHWASHIGLCIFLQFFLNLHVRFSWYQHSKPFPLPALLSISPFPTFSLFLPLISPFEII